MSRNRSNDSCKPLADSDQTKSKQNYKNMPYVLLSTQIRLECGPTIVGDEWSDKELMKHLGATLEKTLGNNFLEYKTPDPPRVVLNKLEKQGYKLVSTCGIGQTCIWTLHKPDSSDTTTVNDNENSLQSDR